MADFPGVGLPAGEEGEDLLAVGLGVEVLPVLGHVADEEHRVVEHDEVLLAVVALAGHQFGAGHVEQLDGHAAGVVGAVLLRVGVAVGEAHPGVPHLARLGEHALAQVGGQVGVDGDFGLHAAVGLGVGVAQHAGVVAVLFDDADGVFDDGLGLLGFVRRDLFLGRDRAAELDAVVHPADAQADEAEQGQAEDGQRHPFAEEVPDPGEQCAHGGGPLRGAFLVFFCGGRVCREFLPSP